MCHGMFFAQCATESRFVDKETRIPANLIEREVDDSVVVRTICRLITQDRVIIHTTLS
jgi:hypothetical protein